MKSSFALSERRNPWVSRATLPLRLATSFARKAPDFLIIGAQKSGTSSLYEQICYHPNIRKAARKEVHYYDWTYNRGEFWYRAHFPLKWRNSVLTGEATPHYLYHPLAAQRIYNDNPDIKLIIVLRDPTERTLAHYRHEVRHGNENLSPVEALKRPENARSRYDQLVSNPSKFNRRDQLYSYVTRGYYLLQIKQYLRYFDRNNILVLNSIDLFDKPKDTVSMAWDFLGLTSKMDDSKFDFAPMNVNPNQKLNDKAVQEKLKTHFYNHNEMLFDYLGKDFGWNS